MSNGSTSQEKEVSTSYSNPSISTTSHHHLSLLRAGSVMDRDVEELRAWLALNPSQPFPIYRLPEPLILQILSSLDLPDLASVAATGNQLLANLATDTVLHRKRLRSVGPKCISPHLRRRPNILEIAKSGKMKGLNLESKILRGCYLSSPNSITLLENSNKVKKLMIKDKLNKFLIRRPRSKSNLFSLNLIDEELRFCSNLLAPVLHRLKRQRAKDLLAKKLRYETPIEFNITSPTITSGRSIN